MLFSGAIDHRIEEERTRGRVDHGRPDNAKRTDVPAWKPDATGGPTFPFPDNAAIGGVERINIIRRSQGNDHRAVWTALDVQRLGMNIAHNRAIKVQVAGEVGRVARREGRIDVQAISGKIVVFLGDVNLRAEWRVTFAINFDVRDSSKGKQVTGTANLTWLIRRRESGELEIASSKEQVTSRTWHDTNAPSATPQPSSSIESATPEIRKAKPVLSASPKES
jgi:hypothetical protein